MNSAPSGSKKKKCSTLASALNLGSPGCDELKWDKPVFPGDTLSIRVTVLETRRSESKPDRGIVRSFVEVLIRGAQW